MLQELDQGLFLWLNQFHQSNIDSLMVFATEKWTWLPWYGVWIFWLGYRYRWRLLPWLICLALLITLADQISSGFTKPFFERLRPCHEQSLQGLIHLLIPNCGGKFGFISSHAANTAVLAAWLITTVLKKNPVLQTIWVLWALLVSYSRIYVGVHYPGDILAGWILGITLAFGLKYCLVQWSIPVSGLYKNA
ncbi:MAG: phosphatase PAP2 family protein [Bacteroidia bacterium]|nr:phosphatase PAP2 family protein [Bacteroidia bacterium]